MTAIIRQFLRLEASGGILLIVAAIIALIMANTPLSALYNEFLSIPIMIKFGALELDKPLILWVNDALMAIFFLVVGLEVKRELKEGSLAQRDRAIFPAIAAVGGMLAPALIYLFFNHGDAIGQQGWAIPAATDIAFALGVMALLGRRVPVELKVFLLALAIIDDLGVIVIIALFYSKSVALVPLLLAALITIMLFILNWRKVSNTAVYLVLGFILWVCILKSGIHATIAGVIVGFLIPLRDKEGASPSEELEHVLHPWVAYLILPLFAFSNAGVSLNGVTLDGMLSTLPVGIALGLFLGKPIGIFLFSWVSVKLGLQNCQMRLILSKYLPFLFYVVSVLLCLSLSQVLRLKVL